MNKAFAALTLCLCAAPAAATGVIVETDGGRSTLRFSTGQLIHQTSAEVRDARRIDVSGSPVVLALWNEVDADGNVTPFNAISLDGLQVNQVRESLTQLRFEHGAFDPLEGEVHVDPLLRASNDGNVWVVQFVTQPLSAYHLGLASLGAKVMAYVPDHAYAVNMDRETKALVEALPYVRSISPYHSAYRIERYVRENLDAQSELRPAVPYNVFTFEAGEEILTSLASKIRSIGGTIQNPAASTRMLEAVLSPEQVVLAARFDEVQTIDRWSPPENDMNNARALSGGTFMNGLGFFGAGVRAEVLDSGFDVNHPEFTPPPIIHGNNPSNGSHGASTYGINFADGTVCAQGVIPDGQGIMSDYGFLGNRANHTAQLVDPGGVYRAVYQTNSWGSSRTTQYTGISAAMDQIIFDTDLLIFNSQSNANSQLSRPQAWAKNIVSCGAINHENTLTLLDDNWGGASIGPASDGRLKPDLAHFYDFINTTTSNANCTSGFGGTSGSTPILAGHTGLFFEMWHNELFGNTAGPTVFESAPHYTLAKAMMIASASQWGFSGTNHNLTRTHQGWGYADLQKLYNTRDRIFWVDETDVLTELQLTSYDIDVAVGEDELKVVMTYSDVPGNPSVQSLHRVNDLSLRVTSPGGDVFFGNVGLDANNYSQTGGIPNEKDTVECVFVQNPFPGTWTVDVVAREINADTHVETGAMDADYALVVLGGVQAAACAPASALFRNGGSNPASLVTSTAPIGGTLNATVDLTTTGHSQAVIFGFDTMANIPLSGGQVLLATDSGSGEVWAQGLVSGPTAVFSIPIVNDPSLCGVTIYTQALHAFGVVPFALSNAQDLTFGL